MIGTVIGIALQLSAAPAFMLQSGATRAPADIPAVYRVRFEQCIDLATDDPISGVTEANAWLIDGGSYYARHCLGYAHSAQGQWTLASNAFERAARDAGNAKDKRSANLWAQAGNSSLAGGDAQSALGYFNEALIQGGLKKADRGEIYLDRARAQVGLKQYEQARKDFDKAHTLVPEDPLGWLLSATLARRIGQLERAQADIKVAASIAPGDPAVGLEAGNIAYKAGKLDVAKRNWEQSVKVAPQSKAAMAAVKYLKQLDELKAEK